MQPIAKLFDDLLTAVGLVDQIKKQHLRLLDGKMRLKRGDWTAMMLKARQNVTY